MTSQKEQPAEVSKLEKGFTTGVGLIAIGVFSLFFYYLTNKYPTFIIYFLLTVTFVSGVSWVPMTRHTKFSQILRSDTDALIKAFLFTLTLMGIMFATHLWLSSFLPIVATAIFAVSSGIFLHKSLK